MPYVQVRLADVITLDGLTAEMDWVTQDGREKDRR